VVSLSSDIKRIRELVGIDGMPLSMSGVPSELVKGIIEGGVCKVSGVGDDLSSASLDFFRKMELRSEAEKVSLFAFPSPNFPLYLLT